jgi:hypothetical protein
LGDLGGECKVFASYPNSIATLLRFKPMAEAVRLTIMMLQELITRSEFLQQTYVNFQYMWTVYETSKLTTDIAENILTPEKYKTGKEVVRQKVAHQINSYDEIVQGNRELPFKRMNIQEVNERNKLVSTTYHSLLWHGQYINAHAAKAAKECSHFDRHYYQPWLKIHRTVNNLARKPGFRNIFITTEGPLASSEKHQQISKKRKRDTKRPKNGFGQKKQEF